jgi:YD repeat-containing protein
VLNERGSVSLDTYVVDLAWSPYSDAIAVAGGEGAVVLVEGVAEKLRHRTLGEHGMGTIAVAWQPGARVVASSGQDSSVALWDTAAPAENALIKRWRPGTAWTDHIAYSPDGKLLATATGKVLSLWTPSGERVQQFDALPASIAALAWDEPGRDLAAAVQGGIHVHRIEPPSFSTRHYSWPAACLTAAYSPNGKVLATGTQDGTVHFWYLLTGKDSQMRGYASRVTQTQWSANSRYLATAAGNDVVVWDFGGRGPEGTRPLELQGHTDRVTLLAFHPEGPWLVSAGRDWRITLWQPGAKDTASVDAHLTSGEITALRWSPDGRMLAVGDAKGRLTLYGLSGRTPSRPR